MFDSWLFCVKRFQMYAKINWQTRIRPFPLRNTSNICFLDIYAFWGTDKDQGARGVEDLAKEGADNGNVHDD